MLARVLAGALALSLLGYPVCYWVAKRDGRGEAIVEMNKQVIITKQRAIEGLQKVIDNQADLNVQLRKQNDSIQRALSDAKIKSCGDPVDQCNRKFNELLDSANSMRFKAGARQHP